MSIGALLVFKSDPVFELITVLTPMHCQNSSSK